MTVHMSIFFCNNNINYVQMLKFAYQYAHAGNKLGLLLLSTLEKCDINTHKNSTFNSINQYAYLFLRKK